MIVSHPVSCTTLGSCLSIVNIMATHSELGYRMNIDPNPNDSYRADEKPVQRAPAQTVNPRDNSLIVVLANIGIRAAIPDRRVNRSRHIPLKSSSG